MTETLTREGRVYLRGEEVERLTIYDPMSELPFEVCMALIEAVRYLPTVLVEVFVGFKGDTTRLKFGRVRIEVLEPGLPVQIERVLSDEDLLPTLARLGLFRMPTSAPEGCVCRNYYLRTGLHAAWGGGKVCPLAEPPRGGHSL